MIVTLLSHAHNRTCAHTYSSLHTHLHITYYTPYHTHYTIFIPYTCTYNMDAENYSIQMFREDLTEDFQSLASTHTTTIGNILEEFNEEQLLMLGTEQALKETTQGQMDEAKMEKAPKLDQGHEVSNPLAMMATTKHQPNSLVAIHTDQIPQNESFPPWNKTATLAPTIEETTMLPPSEDILDILTDE